MARALSIRSKSSTHKPQDNYSPILLLRTLGNYLSCTNLYVWDVVQITIHQKVTTPHLSVWPNKSKKTYRKPRHEEERSKDGIHSGPNLLTNSWIEKRGYTRDGMICGFHCEIEVYPRNHWQKFWSSGLSVINLDFSLYNDWKKKRQIYCGTFYATLETLI